MVNTMKIWMEITKDEYELPIVVADSRKELAEMVGVEPSYISSHIGHYKRGRLKKPRFIVVEIEEDE